MAKQGKGGNAPRGFTDEQKAFLFEGVRMFNNHPDLTHIAIQNDFGAIVLKRDTVGDKPAVRVMGFSSEDFDDEEDEDGEDDFDEEDDEEEEREVLARCWRWFDD